MIDTIRSCVAKLASLIGWNTRYIVSYCYTSFGATRAGYSFVTVTPWITPINTDEVIAKCVELTKCNEKDLVIISISKL